MFKFERLEVWKKAVELYEGVAEAAKELDRRDQGSLGEQVRRAALSIATNIAEATGREGSKESKHFFNIAKGSTYEVVSLLCIMERRGALPTQNYQQLYGQCDEIARMLSGLLRR